MTKDEIMEFISKTMDEVAGRFDFMLAIAEMWEKDVKEAYDRGFEDGRA